MKLLALTFDRTSELIEASSVHGRLKLAAQILLRTGPPNSGPASTATVAPLGIIRHMSNLAAALKAESRG